MIIYFADRKLNILGQASTSLPKGLIISDDTTIEEVNPGVNSFSCRIAYKDESRETLENAAKPGQFILKSGGNAFTESENSYDSLYTIIETEFDTAAQEVYLYAEDAGLDLINKVVPAMTLSSKTCYEMIRQVAPSDWVINTYDIPTTTKSKTWDGENTATERLNSIANAFGCEIYYSFIIERFQVTKKCINVTAHRGSKNAVQQLRLNLDLNSIVTTRSIADLATAYQVTGGIPSSKSTPINLKGYSYSYTDPSTGDLYVVDTATGQMRNKSAMARWASALDSDGLIVKQFNYDTTSQSTLAGQARAELKKHCDEVVNYEIDLVRLPEGTQIGDRINIIDEEGQLYLEARLLQLETSVTAGTQKAVIGEYLIKSSGISAQVQQLASQFSELAQARKFFTWIAYADNESGSGISLTPQGKAYMGLLENQSEELTDVAQAEAVADLFKWSLYQSTTLYIDSSEGVTFKGRNISTRLSVVVFRGTQRITNITDLAALYGSTAELRWYELVGNEFVRVTDSRVTAGGFILNVNSIEESSNYKCELIV